MNPSFVDELRRWANTPPERAQRLPAPVYTWADVLEAQRERIFDPGWICVARTADVADVGDHLTAAMPGPAGALHAVSSVIVVRGDDQQVRVFRNACAHRCATLLDGPGTSARITCPYHAWVYRLDGQLVAAPYMRDAVEADGSPFDPARHHLAELRCEVWEGFVYATNDPSATALAPRLTGLAEVIGRYGAAAYQPVHHEVEVWDTNWLCLMENFMDTYHAFHVHRHSFAAMGDSTMDTVVVPGTLDFAHQTVRDDPNGEFGVAARANHRLEGEWRHTMTLAAVFPTHLFQLQPDWLWSLSLLPLGVDRVRIDWRLAVAPETVADELDAEDYVHRVLRLLRRVNDEDRPVVEGVFRGLQAGRVPTAPWSPLERNVHDVGRSVVERLISRSAQPGSDG